jgi:hypothetical protein
MLDLKMSSQPEIGGHVHTGRIGDLQVRLICCEHDEQNWPMQNAAGIWIATEAKYLKNPGGAVGSQSIAPCAV